MAELPRLRGVRRCRLQVVVPGAPGQRRAGLWVAELSHVRGVFATLRTAPAAATSPVAATSAVAANAPITTTTFSATESVSTSATSSPGTRCIGTTITRSVVAPSCCRPITQRAACLTGVCQGPRAEDAAGAESGTQAKRQAPHRRRSRRDLADCLPAVHVRRLLLRSTVVLLDIGRVVWWPFRQRERRKRLTTCRSARTKSTVRSPKNNQLTLAPPNEYPKKPCIY